MFNYGKLENAIKESGKSRKHFCDLVNRPYYYIRDVLKQKNNIPPEYQAIWAKELGVSVEWLNDEPEKEKAPAPEREDFNVDDLIDSMTVEQLADLIRRCADRLSQIKQGQ